MTRKETKTDRCEDQGQDETPQSIRAELSGGEKADESIQEIPEAAWYGPAGQNMQQSGAWQGQVIIQAAIHDDIAQIEGVSEKHSGQSESSGRDTENQEHIGQLPAADILEAVEENDPDQEVNTVVQDHADGL